MGNNPSNPNGPRVIPTDPYIQALGGNVLKWEPPPAAAAPMSGENSVLRLHVPAEQTELDFGAGKTPGIRMATDNHVHMTARTPRTTISLGSPGGDGIGDAAMGLQVFTAGEKRETVDGSTIEWYKGTKTEHVLVNLAENYDCPKTETVKGIWGETCHSAKTETVEGTVTQNFKAEHNLTVGKQAVHKFKGKTEVIDGVSFIHVTGKREEHFDSDHKWVHGAAANDVYLGERVAMYVGLNSSITVGTKADYAALKLDYASGSLKKGEFTIEKLQSAVRDVGADIKRAKVAMQDAALEYGKSQAAIHCSDMTIFKG